MHDGPFSSAVRVPTWSLLPNPYHSFAPIDLSCPNSEVATCNLVLAVEGNSSGFVHSAHDLERQAFLHTDSARANRTLSRSAGIQMDLEPQAVDIEEMRAAQVYLNLGNPETLKRDTSGSRPLRLGD